MLISPFQMHKYIPYENSTISESKDTFYTQCEPPIRCTAWKGEELWRGRESRENVCVYFGGGGLWGGGILRGVIILPIQKLSLADKLNPLLHCLDNI